MVTTECLQCGWVSGCVRGQTSLAPSVYAPSVQKSLEDMCGDEAAAACEEDSSHFEGSGTMLRIALEGCEVKVTINPQRPGTSRVYIFDALSARAQV